MNVECSWGAGQNFLDKAKAYPSFSSHEFEKLRPEDGDVSASEVRAASLVVLIEPRLLNAQCMYRAFSGIDASSEFKIYRTMSEWISSDDRAKTSLLLFCLSKTMSQEGAVASLEQDISQLQSEAPSVKFAVLSDQEAPGEVMKALQAGAQGFLTTSLSIEVMAQILQLLTAGGTYVPTSSLMGMTSAPIEDPANSFGTNSVFTSRRQLLVARALRKGAPNKVIAYQLNMCESTVKVHVRNIMKKLKAKNRTEIALLMAQMFPDDSDK